jgi:hypothetical protein
MRRFCKTLSRKLVLFKFDKNNGYFTWKPTYIYDYLPELFLELEKFQTKFVEKIETHILCWITFFFYNRAAFETRPNTIVAPGWPQTTVWRMRISRWVTEATDTHNKQYLLLFHYNSGYVNAPQSYVVSTLHVLFLFHYSSSTSLPSVHFFLPKTKYFRSTVLKNILDVCASGRVITFYVQTKCNLGYIGLF